MTLPIDLTFERSTRTEGKYLVFDFETTGFIPFEASLSDFSNWPYAVQIAWMLFDEEGKLIEERDYVIKQDTEVPDAVVKFHGITTEVMRATGIDPREVYCDFDRAVRRTEYLVAHNINFDLRIARCEFLRNGIEEVFESKKAICTMKSSADFCKLPPHPGRTGYKDPKLSELYIACFHPDNPDIALEGLHRAGTDVRLTAKSFFKLKEMGAINEL